MSKRDSKGRFVSSGNSSKYAACKKSKCTCKEAKKSMRDKMEKMYKKLDAEGELFTMVNGKPEEINEPYTIIQGYAVPLNPKFLEEYLETLSWAYPDNVKMVHTSEEVEDEEDDFEECEEPNIVFCFGEDPCADDPDAPKPVWDKDTEVIHIDAKNKKAWVEKPETVNDTEASEHFRRLKAASDKLKKGCLKAAPVAAAAMFPKEAALIMAAIKFLKELEELKEK